MNMIKKMLGLLGRREQMQAVGLLGLFLLMSLCEVVGIASILPFMSVLADPDSVTHNEWLRRGYEFFEFSSPKEYLFFIGLGVLIILVVTNIIKAVTRWVTLYVTQSWGEGLSRRLFDIYLRQPYRFFLDRTATHILAFEGDSQVVFFEGNFEAYEKDRKRRLGAEADQPHRLKFKKLVR